MPPCKVGFKNKSRGEILLNKKLIYDFYPFCCIYRIIQKSTGVKFLGCNCKKEDCPGKTDLKWTQIPSDCFIHPSLNKDDIQNSLKYMPPSTNSEEQRRLKYFMENRKKMSDEKKNEEKDESRSFHSDLLNPVCAMFSLILMFLGFLILIYILSSDVNYYQELNNKIALRHHS